MSEQYEHNSVTTTTSSHSTLQPTSQLEQVLGSRCDRKRKISSTFLIEEDKTLGNLGRPCIEEHNDVLGDTRINDKNLSNNDSGVGADTSGFCLMDGRDANNNYYYCNELPSVREGLEYLEGNKTTDKNCVKDDFYELQNYMEYNKEKNSSSGVCPQGYYGPQQFYDKGRFLFGTFKSVITLREL